MRVGRADLRRAKPQVQAAREPVEYIETWCCVLDLDRIEVELGREPSNAMNRTASHLSLCAPEGMSGHGQTTLLVDRIHGRRSRHPRPDPALQEQRQDVPVAARHLLADDHLQPSPAAGAIDGSQRALDRVVISDCYHVKIGVPDYVIHELCRAWPTI